MMRNRSREGGPGSDGQGGVERLDERGGKERLSEKNGEWEEEICSMDGRGQAAYGGGLSMRGGKGGGRLGWREDAGQVESKDGNKHA